jgi:hypothetical protein
MAVVKPEQPTHFFAPPCLDCGKPLGLIMTPDPRPFVETRLLALCPTCAEGSRGFGDVWEHVKRGDPPRRFD